MKAPVLLYQDHNKKVFEFETPEEAQEFHDRFGQPRPDLSATILRGSNQELTIVEVRSWSLD